jgi:hypothetical protein
VKNNEKNLRFDQIQDKTLFGYQITAVIPPLNRVFLQAR